MAKTILDKIPNFLEGEEKEIFSCNDGCYMMRITGTGQQDFTNYVQQLSKMGYAVYASHTILENEFVTLLGEECLVQAYFTPCDKVTRIVADPNRTLYHKEQEVIAQKVCDTTLYQMELDYRTINCGMCYITQCEDGSFFIIDSAHMNSVNDHIRIHNLLRNLTPKGQRIVISGWFFTHAHQDHIVKFMDFVEADFSDYEIECLYYNFPELTVMGSACWSDSDKQTMREFAALIKKHPDIPVVKLHTGEHFFVRNLEFEVLATHEDIYPGTLACYNDSSAVLLMTVKDCKVVFLGDANFMECDILIDRYRDYVKSDLVQVAHHGYNGENVEIYRYIEASVALYSNRHADFEQLKDTPSNRLLVSMSKEIYLAEDGTTAFSLPYKAGTAVIFPKEVSGV